MARLRLLTLWLALGTFLLPRPVLAASARVSDGRPAMGTVLEITLEGTDPARLHTQMEELFALVSELEATLTTWDEASPMQTLNRAAGGPARPVPPELFALLQRAKAGSRATDGVFDVTVGPLLALWREAARRGRLPDENEITAARARVDASGIELEAGRARLAEGVVVDLGGIAKGFALDRLAGRLDAVGAGPALLDFGGSSWWARGAPEGEPGWRILVAKGPGTRTVVVLRDEALSVSESLGQGFTIGDRRLGHVIDPHSGWPVEHAGRAAARAPTATWAEIWSTALLVWPPEEALRRARAEPEVEALILDEAGTRRETPGFATRRLLAPAGGTSPVPRP